MKDKENPIDEMSRSMIKGFEGATTQQEKAQYYFGYLVMFLGLLAIFYGLENARDNSAIDFRIFIGAFATILTGYINVNGRNRNPYASFVFVIAFFGFNSIPINPGWSFALLLLGSSIVALIIDRKTNFNFYKSTMSVFRKARKKE